MTRGWVGSHATELPLRCIVEALLSARRPLAVRSVWHAASSKLAPPACYLAEFRTHTPARAVAVPACASCYSTRLSTCRGSPLRRVSAQRRRAAADSSESDTASWWRSLSAVIIGASVFFGGVGVTIFAFKLQMWKFRAN